MPSQIIVYCSSVQQTVRYAEKLGAVCYHRRVESKNNKAEQVRQLTKGQQQVFIATNALGLEIDQSTICVVIHNQPPKKMQDYAQETGRAGQGGQPSEAIVVIGAAYRANRTQQVSS
jgi:superfamily II DNA helicase RecQ